MKLSSIVKFEEPSPKEIRARGMFLWPVGEIVEPCNIAGLRVPELYSGEYRVDNISNERKGNKDIITYHLVPYCANQEEQYDLASK